MPHLAQELQRMLPLNALLASADRCVKGDRVWLDPVVPHLAKEFQRLLPLHALLASADRCANCDRVWRDLGIIRAIAPTLAYIACSSRKR